MLRYLQNWKDEIKTRKDRVTAFFFYKGKSKGEAKVDAMDASP